MQCDTAPLSRVLQGMPAGPMGGQQQLGPHDVHDGMEQGAGWAHDFVMDPAQAAAVHQEMVMHQEAAAVAAEQTWAAELEAHRAAEEKVREASAEECSCAWVEELKDQEGHDWAHEFTAEDVQVFTVEGEPLRTVEEKNADSKFYDFMRKVNTGEVVIEEPDKATAGPSSGLVGGETGTGSWDDEFARLTGQPGEGIETMTEEQRKMVEDYEQSLLQQDDDGEVDDEGGIMDGAWAEGAEGDPDKWASELAAMGHGAEGEEWAQEYQEVTRRMQEQLESCDYPFEENNVFLAHDNPFDEGLGLMVGGALSEAVLAFEAACQQQPERIEAWLQLGKAQQENEKDPLAIRALNRARKINPTCHDIHQALAVSHTNEANYAQALQALRAWISNHPEYAPICAAMAGRTADPLEGEEFASEFLSISPSEHREICHLFQAALELHPDDLDVLVGLGVLRNLSREYEEAAECFRRATTLNPTDATLWNKLGATLANGDKSREAIGAYERALDVNPGFVRARYNLGIAFSNLGEHNLAAAQFIRTIVMQQGGVTSGGETCPNRSAREVWDVLRMSLNLMEREDLVAHTWEMRTEPLVAAFSLTDLV